jgi:hypothetical protein
LDYECFDWKFNVKLRIERMGLFSFYNMRKPRKFSHKPIYWDPRKEELDERIRKIEIEMGVRQEDPQDYKPSIKGTFIEGTTHLRKSRARGDDTHSRESKTMRLLLILILLGAIFWFFFLR